MPEPVKKNYGGDNDARLKTQADKGREVTANVARQIGPNPLWPGEDVWRSREDFDRALAEQYGAARYGDRNSEAQQALRAGVRQGQAASMSNAASQMGMSKGGQMAMGGQMAAGVGQAGARASQELLAAEQAQARQRYADMLKAQRAADIDLQRAMSTSYAADQSSRAAAAEAAANRSQNLISLFTGWGS